MHRFSLDIAETCWQSFFTAGLMLDLNVGRVETVFLETVSLCLSYHYHVAQLPHLNSSQNFIDFYRYNIWMILYL